MKKKSVKYKLYLSLEGRGLILNGYNYTVHYIKLRNLIAILYTTQFEIRMETQENGKSGTKPLTPPTCVQ